MYALRNAVTCTVFRGPHARLWMLAGVLIDLHAAAGSQNGNDNSAPAAQGIIGWDSDPTYATQTVAFVSALAARYASAPALLGFGLLNEPMVNSDCFLLRVISTAGLMRLLFGMAHRSPEYAYRGLRAAATRTGC